MSKIKDALEAAEHAIRMAQNFPSTGELYKRSYEQALTKIAEAKTEVTEPPQPRK